MRVKEQGNGCTGGMCKGRKGGSHIVMMDEKERTRNRKRSKVGEEIQNSRERKEKGRDGNT